METRHQIFSIFGQIEEVAAKVMLKNYSRSACSRIDTEMIPPTALYNDAGQKAKFAIMLRPSLVPEFEQLIDDLRA